MNILGVRVNNLSQSEVFDKLQKFFAGHSFNQITTINPEFVLEAQKNKGFRNILNASVLNVADGFGIKLAFWRFGEPLKSRIAGIDLMQEILKIAEKNNFRIFLIANSRGLSSWEEASQAIMKRFSKLEIGGINLNYNSQAEVQSLKFKVQGYEIIFANLGAPHQEELLNSLKTPENSKIRLVMGVGGSFDYLTGKVPRAPRFMRQMGLEWLFRLIIQPNRIKRILNSVIIFPIKVIFSR